MTRVECGKTLQKRKKGVGGRKKLAREERKGTLPLLRGTLHNELHSSCSLGPLDGAVATSFLICMDRSPKQGIGLFSAVDPSGPSPIS